MNGKLFNGPMELLLRALIILTIKSPLNVDHISMIDFVSTYGKYFGISENNLHGDNEFGLQEFSLRRELMNDAIRQAVLKGLVEIVKNQDGFSYKLSTNGTRVYSEISKSMYALEYFENAKKAKNIVAVSNKEFMEIVDNKLWGGSIV